MSQRCVENAFFKQHKIRTLHRNRELRMWSVNLMREKAIKIVGSQGGRGNLILIMQPGLFIPSLLQIPFKTYYITLTFNVLGK